MDESREQWSGQPRDSEYSSPNRNAAPPPRHYPYPPYPASRYGMGPMFLQSCLVAGCASIIAPLVLFTALAIAVGYGIASGLADADGTLDAVTSSNIREKLVRRGAEGAGTIAIVSIKGAIMGDGSPLEGDGQMAWVSEQLKAAGENDQVRAVILQIDSPGGGLTASDLLHNEVKKLRAKGKNVIAWAGNMMASGGYYIAVASEGIMANPTSTVGSIGVIMQHFEIQDLLNKIGVNVNPITAGEHKDIGSLFRPMEPDEREFLEDHIRKAYDRFVDIVAEGRGMAREDVVPVADGRIFTADEAVALNLIDRIGYADDAVDWAEQLAGGNNMRVIAYRRIISFSDIFRDASQEAAVALRNEAAPKAMAAWDGK